MEKLIIGSQRKRGDDGYHTFSVRIKEETVEKLDGIAKETGRTRNNLIGLLLEYAVDNCVIEKNEEP